MLRHGHIEVFVRDMAASRAFWEGALGAELDEVQHEGRIVWLRLGGGSLMLREAADAAGGRATDPPRPGDRYAEGRRGTAIVLYTDDVPGELRRLASRGVRPDGDDGPGCPTFRDPDGNWIQIVDPRHA